MSLEGALSVLGPQEGLCEAGVFGLGKRGWRIVSRRRFTQMGTAIQWGEDEAEKVGRDEPKKWKRLRASVVTVGDAETLEDVCEQYEDSRKSGDPKFNAPPDERPGVE